MLDVTQGLEVPTVMTKPHELCPVPQIRNRRLAIEYDDGASALGCWLPQDGPFGNLQHWPIRIMLRVDDANGKIASAFAQWPRVPCPMSPNRRSRHRLDLENAVFMLRRAADEIVSLHAILSHLEEHGRYPERIGCDCVDALLKHGAALEAPPFRAHRDTLRMLSDINNADRHVFVEAGLAAVAAPEPAICAVGLRRNSIGPRLFHVSMRYFVGDFDRFYGDAMDWLCAWSERQMRKSAA